MGKRFVWNKKLAVAAITIMVMLGQVTGSSAVVTSVNMGRTQEITMAMTGTQETVAWAPDDVKVIVDGQVLAFPDQKPIIKDGRTLLPIKHVSVALGAEVEWIGDLSKVVIRGSNTIELILGQKLAKVGDKVITLDVPAQALNGRTMVPLKFVSVALGAEVNWDGNTRTVTITTGAGVELPEVLEGEEYFSLVRPEDRHILEKRSAVRAIVEKDIGKYEFHIYTNPENGRKSIAAKGLGVFTFIKGSEAIHEYPGFAMGNEGFRYYALNGIGLDSFDLIIVTRPGNDTAILIQNPFK